MSKQLFLLIGPSGAGKTTLAQHLKSIDIPEIVSHTTRKPREGEIYDVTYHYVTREEFRNHLMVEQTEYNGNLYGTSVGEVKRVLDKKKSFIMRLLGRFIKRNESAFVIVDKHGVKAFKDAYGDMCKVIYIYLNQSELYTRMTERGDDADAIYDRLTHAHETGEFDNIDLADYVIVNRDLEQSKRLLEVIALG